MCHRLECRGHGSGWLVPGCSRTRARWRSCGLPSCARTRSSTTRGVSAAMWRRAVASMWPASCAGAASGVRRGVVGAGRWRKQRCGNARQREVATPRAASSTAPTLPSHYMQTTDWILAKVWVTASADLRFDDHATNREWCAHHSRERTTHPDGFVYRCEIQGRSRARWIKPASRQRPGGRAPRPSYYARRVAG